MPGVHRIFIKKKPATMRGKTPEHLKAIFDQLCDSNKLRFRNSYEGIIEKYSKIPEYGRDVIDLKTLTIVQDYGTIKQMDSIQVGHYADKYLRSEQDFRKLEKLMKVNKFQKDKKKFKKMTKDIKFKSGKFKKSFLKGTLSSIYYVKTNRVKTINFRKLKYSKTGKYIISHKNNKLCTKLTSFENVVLRKNQFKKISLINDLFTYKNRKGISEMSLIANTSPNKKTNNLNSKQEKCRESSIPKENMTPFDAITYKNGIDISEMSLIANTSPNKKTNNLSSKQEKCRESSIPKENMTPFENLQRIDGLFKYSQSNSAPRSLLKCPELKGSPETPKNWKLDSLISSNSPSIQKSKSLQKLHYSIMKKSPQIPNCSELDDLIHTPSVHKSKMEYPDNLSKSTTLNACKKFDLNKKKLVVSSIKKKSEFPFKNSKRGLKYDSLWTYSDIKKNLFPKK